MVRVWVKIKTFFIFAFLPLLVTLQSYWGPIRPCRALVSLALSRARSLSSSTLLHRRSRRYCPPPNPSLLCVHVSWSSWRLGLRGSTWRRKKKLPLLPSGGINAVGQILGFLAASAVEEQLLRPSVTIIALLLSDFSLLRWNPNSTMDSIFGSSFHWFLA